MGSIVGISSSINLLKQNEDGAKYQVQIEIPISLGWIDEVDFIVYGYQFEKSFRMKHLKNQDEKAYFETEIELPVKAIYHYHFSFSANHEKIDYANDGKLSVNFSTPDWAKGKIMYHIFVDRFSRGNTEPLPEMKNRTIHSSWQEDVQVGPDEKGRWNIDFFGGDLKGIIEKLDYIKSLGVSILYLSPIFWSQSNHRYDTSDYEKIDPYAGSNEDLTELCLKAHEMNMKVILDAVFNHTGSDSKYFNEYGTFPELGASQSRESKYYPFFKKQEYGNETSFDYWWGMKNLPVCDGYSQKWQEYIYGEGGVIDLWFSLGIDGLRLDVADELTDEFIEGIRSAVKRNKEDGFILGEVWKNPMRMNRGYIASGKGMDSVMNYPLVDALLRYYKYADIYTLQDVFYQLKNEYPKETLQSLMNFTSTHDITRAINLFASDEFDPYGEWAWNLKNSDYSFQKNYQLSLEDYEMGKKKYASYLYALTFFPGNLSIFYGDEVGLQGMGNLANRKPFPWEREDQELLTLFQKIGKIRGEEPFLEKADFDIVEVNDRILRYRRITGEEEALISVNRSPDIVPLTPIKAYEEPDKIYPLGESTEKEVSSYGAVVLKKVKKKDF